MDLSGAASPGMLLFVTQENFGFVEKLRQHIVEFVTKSNRGIAFSRFMRLALYHREWGYYAQPREIGKRGDFFTSVSVGPCFGTLLARQIRQIWQNLGHPRDFCVVEQGAHDGQLAADILDALAEIDVPVSYAIVEPNPAFRAKQAEKLGPRATHHHNVADFRAKTGVLLCNELLDAFPVDRFRFVGGEWRELRVILDEAGNLAEGDFPLKTGLPPNFPKTAPEGFTTEFCPEIEPWIRELSQIFDRGVALIVDYGLLADEFFEPARADGTLRCFRSHQSQKSPFEGIGETDLTAHVNFTQVMDCARENGLETLGFVDQSRFLTGIAADWLREIEKSGESTPLIRQFQTLTHPGSMGSAFHALVLGKNVPGLEIDGLRFARQAC